MLLFAALFSLGFFFVFLNNSINPLINKLDQDIIVLSEANTLEVLTLRMITFREDQEHITENYIDTPNALAVTKYDFSRSKTQELINSMLRKEKHGAALLNISVVETNIERIERKIILLVQNGNIDEARALFVSVEYEVLRANFDTFVDQFRFANKAKAGDSFSRLVSLSSSIETSRQQLNTFMVIIILSIVAIFILGFTVSLSISRSIAKPLGELTKGVERISKGDLRYTIDVKSKDEIGQLAIAFNVMTGKLQSSYENLDGKIREKTRFLEEAKEELQVKVAALVEVNDFMVGRELKMIDLKKEIEELQGKISDEV